MRWGWDIVLNVYMSSVNEWVVGMRVCIEKCVVKLIHGRRVGPQ